MQLQPHSPADFAQAMRELLPPGEAWQWPAGGLGSAVLETSAQELARVDAMARAILEAATQAHAPVSRLWRLQDYMATAQTLDASVQMRQPKPFCAGKGAAGDQVWGDRARYALVVRYDVNAVQLQALRGALAVFKQAHVAIFYEAAQRGGYAVELSDA